jgi:antirestriction protein ArdC
VNQFSELTEKILKFLKKGVAPWRRPWEDGKPGTKYPQSSMDLPRNAKSGKQYQGLNITILWMTAMERNFQYPHWASLKQWEQMGATILPGHLGRSTAVLFSIRIKAQDRKDLKPDDPRHDKFVYVWHEVYNLAQVTGCNHLRQQSKPQVKKEEEINFQPAEKLLLKKKVNVQHGGDRAFYSVSGDYIQIPVKSKFRSRSGYYTTKMHELVHWTGHPDRKNRIDLNNGQHFTKTSREYAFEELIAELGSCFLLARLNLPEQLDEMPNHASYLDYWSSILQEDDRAIWRAAAKAGAAVTFLVGKPRKPRKKKRDAAARRLAALKAWETRRRKQEDQGLCLST